MQLIRCTQKLLKEIPNQLVEDLADPAVSGWHANLLRIERRKCVLFTHDETLFSVFIPELKKPDFVHLQDVFGQRLFKAMLWNEFTQTQIEAMLELCREIHFAKSSNRSVLGSMNDMRVQIEWYVERDGGLESVDLMRLHHDLNRTPYKAVGYQYPVERLRACLEQQIGNETGLV